MKDKEEKFIAFWLTDNLCHFICVFIVLTVSAVDTVNEERNQCEQTTNQIQYQFEIRIEYTF